MSFFACRLLASLAAALIIAGCAADIKATDPHLVGSRDMNYDHLIVPGDRIGPVRMGGSVSDAIQHLGEPDSVTRFNGDEVIYFYKDECIEFTWEDSGVEPQVESGLRGINVYCDKWATVGGLRVGSSLKEVVSQIGEYCEDNNTGSSSGSLMIASKSGIWFWAQDRNSPVSSISVVSAQTSWNGMCKD